MSVGAIGAQLLTLSALAAGLILIVTGHAGIALAVMFPGILSAGSQIISAARRTG